MARAAAATELPDDLASGLWSPAFPSAAAVGAAAALIPEHPCGQEREGPNWRVTIAPGAVKVRTVDEAKAERTEQRERDRRVKTADQAAAWLAAGDEIPEPVPGRVITEFSRRSVARLTETLCSLDFAELFADPARVPAMVTVTYPRCWLPVAPRGQAVKDHLKALRKRYERAFGEPLRCVWKQEFQARQPGKRCGCSECAGRDDGRAPHVHMLLVPPHQPADDGRQFRQWLSETWAEIVDHPDPEQYARHVRAGTAVDFAEGLRARDPKRVAVYFTKHGLAEAKGYQHLVPGAWREPGDGPGRFWGYWGLHKIEHVVSVSPALGAVAGRILRRWSRAEQVTRQVRRPRAKGGRPVSKYPEVIGLAGVQLVASRRVKQRRTRTRAVRARNGRGWVSVNSGADYGAELGYALHQHLTQAHRDADRAEWRRCGLDSDPLARAVALRPGPRRDALVARLQARTNQ